MWSPTHVQVTVCRAKGLLTKGKNGTNDAFVTIALGKEKFQTSVKQKALLDEEWQEECELPIPTQGNTAEVVLTVYHQNFIGVDEFLGMVSIPLSQFDVYERPKSKFYTLKSKPGQESKTKSRGELEVRVGFTVKSGSLLELSKKEKIKGSLGQINQTVHSIGGSLLSLGGKERKGLKKLASTVGHKLKMPGRSSRDEKSEGRLSRHSSGRFSDKYSSGEPDPGVISEDEDEFRFDELSHKSSGSSINLAGSQASGSLENLGGGELVRRNSMNRGGTLPSRLATVNSANLSNSGAAKSAAFGSTKNVSSSETDNEWNRKLFGKQSKAENHRMKMAASFHQRVVVGEEMSANQSKDFNPNSISTAAHKSIHAQYQGKTREELVRVVEDRDKEIQNLKEYIDTLLLRVMDTCPTVLQTPFKKNPSKK